uniref:Uncharacterized protein n=1 Tax=Solanum lycopersicum TaxID=4081 RepID=K4D1I8_SOLLC
MGFDICMWMKACYILTFIGERYGVWVGRYDERESKNVASLKSLMEEEFDDVQGLFLIVSTTYSTYSERLTPTPIVEALIASARSIYPIGIGARVEWRKEFTPAQATQVMDLIEGRWEELIGEMTLKITYPALEGHKWKITTGLDPKKY